MSASMSAISARFTMIAFILAKEAIIELIIKPDCPNSIKQILVTILITINIPANFSAGKSENI